jgi:uncharacterized protein (DUF983 family)
MGLKGVCPKCGVTFCGWALENPDNQRCENCKTDLVITNDNQNQDKGIEPTGDEEDAKE